MNLRLSRAIDGLAAGRRRVVLASAIAGSIAALGQAPVLWYPATFIGLAAGFALWRRTPTLSHAAWAGWGLGAGYFALALVWIVQPFLVDIARHGWMAPFALVLMAGGLALFWALAGWGARWLAPGRWGWVAWPVAMGIGEMLRGVLFTGFPWAGPGQALVDTPLMQLAACIGGLGLSVLVLAGAAGLARAVMGPMPLRFGAALAAGIAAALIFGVVRLAQPIPQPASPIVLRLVQPNAPQHLKWHPDHAWGFFDRQLDLTRAQGTPDLVIWPESAVPFLLERNPAALAEIAITAAPATAIIGAQRSTLPRYYNAIAVLDADGVPTDIYDKHHLVPFGEYIPLGDLFVRFGIYGLAAQRGNGYAAGPGARIIDLGAAGKVLPLICYEAIFARDLRAAPERADWILQLTNDAWFGTFSGPYQHLAQARLRAVEFGLPLVRVANTGVSAVIDARGQITDSLALNQSGYLDAVLPGALPRTLYARFGDAPVVLLMLIVGVALFLQRGRTENDISV